MAEKDTQEIATFCRLCEAFCGLTATVKEGKLVSLGPDRRNPHSEGHLCVKGVALTEIINDSDRVLRPLKRVGKPGEFVPVSWDEALDDISKRMNGIIDQHGPEAVATYFGNPGAFSTDTFMASIWFLNTIGSKKFFSAGTQDTSSRLLANYLLYGITFRNAIPDLPNCDFLIIIGANPLISHGGLLTAPRVRRDLDGIAKRGRVVVIDPRRTETAAVYEHVPVQPDTDAWLLAAMLRTIFEEGLAATEFLDKHTVGWMAFRDAVKVIDVDNAATRTKIDAATIRDLARSFAAAKRAAIYGRTGTCRGTYSTLINVMIDALNICTGKFGVVGGSTFGAFPLMGGPDPLAGYIKAGTRIGNLPIVSGMVPAAVMPDDILEPGVGKVRALMLVAGNPVLSAPGGQRLQEALESLELLISADLYVTESNSHAHYILPAASFLEKDDVPLIGLSHMVRPYIQYSPPTIKKMGEARDEFDIFTDLAQRMGYTSIHPGAFMRFLSRLGIVVKPMHLVDMALRLGPLGDRFGLRKGLSLKKLAARPHGVMLDIPLTYAAWQKHIAHKDGRIRLWNELLEEEFARLASESRQAPDPRLKLFSQRTLKSLNSWMHNSVRLSRGQSPVLLIHPKDAAELGIVTGNTVSVASAHGKVDVIAEVSVDVICGAVCYPHGWGHAGGWRNANSSLGVNINVLLPHGPDAVERVSGVSFIDGIPVNVERCTKISSDSVATQ